MNLRALLLPAAGWSAMSSFTRAALYLVQLAILARFLSAEDFGLMAMAGIVLGLGQLFSDFGLGSAYIQRQSVSERERSSLFWLNMLGGIGLALVLSLCSPLLAMFFKEPRLISLICLSSLTFPIHACGQQLRMHAEKSLAFDRIGRIEVVSAFAGLAVGVGAAWGGFGVYALVLSAIAVVASESILAWLMLADGWRPQRHCDIQEVKPYFKFGLGLVGSNLANHLALSLDLLIGGRLFSAAQLGLYSVPRNLMLQVYFVTNPIVTRIGFPLMARMQESPDKIRTVYLAAVGATLCMNAPIYAACIVFAEDIVAILLGPVWSDAAQYMRILSLWGLMRSIGNPVGSLLYSLGRTGLAFRWNLILLFVSMPILLFGSSLNLAGLAWAMLSIACLVWLPAWYFLIHPGCGLRMVDYAIACVRPVLLAAVAMALGYVFSRGVPDVFERLIYGMLLAGSIYVALTYWLNRQWWVNLDTVR